MICPPLSRLQIEVSWVPLLLVLSTTWPSLLMPIKEFGLEPGTFTEVNTFCASAKPESDTANAATTAIFFMFSIVIRPPLRKFNSNAEIGTFRGIGLCQPEKCKPRAILELARRFKEKRQL
jgi:hypothetical protein